MRIAANANILISIHLMLMLILMLPASQLNYINFNTSHVNVNQAVKAEVIAETNISIHLMLMLISYKY